MNKRQHEIRDPIHTFIRLETDERRVVDSRAFQRLRHVHQLALTHLIYPGATHRRFEHSLGVMELAGRVYDIVTNPANLCDDSVRDLVPEQGSFDLQYWRRVVRMAALCHDIGHLPFSHAGEDLLPDGKKHEHLTIALVESELLQPLWRTLIAQGLAGQFNDTFVHYSWYRERSRAFDFPVWTRTGVASSADLSDILQRLPVVAFDYVFVARAKKAEAERWLKDNRDRLLTPEQESDG